MRSLVLVMLFLGSLAAVVNAQTNWIISGSGDFNTASNWDNGAPTSATNTFITNGTSGTPTVVNLAGVGNVADLQINPFNTLNVNPGAELIINGTAIDNSGSISVNAGGGNNTSLVLSGNTTLTGGGTLALSSGDNWGQVYLQPQTGNLTLTNVDNTIQGYGIIGNGGLTFINAGTVDANSSGNSLTLNGSGGITNAGGLLEATNGGTLLIAATVNNQNGNITSNGGTVDIVSGSTIQGGTLGGANLETTNSAVLDGSTLGALTLAPGGVWTGQLNTSTFVSGSIVNQGTMNFIAGSGNNTNLILNGNTTLTGGGTVTLNSGDNWGQIFVDQQAAGLTLTNVDNTIQGYGVIGNGGLTFINQKTVNANSSGNTLTLNGGGGITNVGGLLEATNGATLLIATAVNNQNGNITSNGGTVNIVSGSTIQGGTLGGANLETTNSAVLDGSTLGALTLAAGGVWTGQLNTSTFVSGSIVNQGAIAFIAGSGNNTVLGLNGNTALTGGGTVTLNSGDNWGQVYIQQQVGGLTLTNVDNTIQGYGVIGNGGLTFINQKTVDADSDGNTLTLNGGGGVNNSGALIEATNGATLVIATAVDNQAGNITSAGSTVNIINGCAIQGGTLNGPGFGTTNSALLDGSTASGPVTLASDCVWTGGLGTTTYVNGSIVNKGAMAFTAGSGNNTVLGLNGNTTLTGGGTLTLNSGDNWGQVYIQQQVGSLTLTNVDNTIQGYGVIGNGGLTFINQKTVNANSDGNALTLNGGGGVTNSGALIEATNGGTLVIATVVDNQGGNITSAGSTVNIISGCAIQGGTLNGPGFGTTNSAVLDGFTQGALTLAPDFTWTAGLGTTTCVNGAIVNKGAMAFTAGSGSNTFLGLNGNTTLTGGGTITLNSGDNWGQVYVQQQVGSLTLTNADNTIQGYGVIGNGGLTLVNGPAGKILANAPGQTLVINGSGGLTNHGTLQVNGGSSLQVAASLQNAGTVVLDASATGAGILSQTGNYIQGSTGTLIETIAPGFNGTFNVTGNVNLDGTLNVNVVNGFTPAAGEMFTVVGFTGTLTGAFSNFGGSDPGDWTLLYNNPDQIDLEFTGGVLPVPEPGVWMDIALMLPLVLLCPVVRKKAQSH